MQFSSGLKTRVFLAGLTLSGCALLLGLSGCKPSAEKRAARQALLNTKVEKMIGKTQMLQADNQTDQALQILDSGLNDPTYKAFAPRLFARKIELFLFQNRDQEAARAILDAWKNAPDRARAVFGTLNTYYGQQKRFQEVRPWCQKLLAGNVGLPKELKSQVWEWQLSAALSLSDTESANCALDDLVTNLKPEDAVPVIQQKLAELINAGHYAIALSLIRHVEAKTASMPLYRPVCAVLVLRCRLSAKDWPHVPAAYEACIALLPDDQLLGVSRTVFTTLQKNSRRDIAEQLSHRVISQANVKTNSANYAARVWIDAGVTADKTVLPDRLNALLDAHVAPVQVGNLFDRYFYAMTEHLDIIRRLCTVGNRIVSACQDKETVNAIKVKILDGAFITDNFDLAVQMLEQGIPGKDKAWHDMSISKVKAHRALAQKKPREAVTYFRAFMDAWIASGQKEEYDPTSGIAYSSEWILGRNANRIATILDSIPDKPEAAKAQAEAKAYFKTALEKAASDPEALKLLKEETKGMGL